jgi:hypothetical protein
MRDFPARWFVAGGWAIDLYLERVTRPHADIEVALLRRDQAALRDHFPDWQWQQVVAGAFAPWRRDEWLELPVFELYAHHETIEPRRLEVLLNEARGDEWVYRRNAAVTRPLSACWLTSAAGVHVLAPEIVLLYKSKAPRPKDEQDFAAVCSRLEPERRAWLRAVLAVCAPGHAWLRRL